MSYSTIKIKFTQELVVGKQVGFDANTTYAINNTPSSTSFIENFVTTRNTLYQVTTATTTTPIQGEQTAINYFTALQTDLSSYINPYGYSISRTGNEITITATNLSNVGTTDFLVNGILTTYTNPSSVQFTINNQYDNTPSGTTAVIGNQVQLNWAGASDDIGIKGYELIYNIKDTPTWSSVPMIYKNVGSGSFSFTISTQKDHNFGIRTIDTSDQKSQWVYLTVPITPSILISSNGLDNNNSACSTLQPSIVISISSPTPVVSSYVTYPDNTPFNGFVNGVAKYWKILCNNVFYSCRIDINGQILESVDCSALPIPKKLTISTGTSPVNNAPPATMCGLATQNNVYYMNNLSVGTIINSNSDGINVSSPFYGGNKYYLLSDDTTTQVAKISSNPAGSITELLPYSSLNCPTGGGCCLLAGTKVTLYDCTYINIEDIKGGEIVLTYNIEKSIYEKGMITKVFKPIHNDIIKLIIKDIIIDCTSTHPFWSVNKNKWVSLNPEETLLSMNIDIELLEKGDILLNEKNEEVILDDILIIKSEDILTYDISVEPNNTYYANGILVHNKGEVPNPPII